MRLPDRFRTTFVAAIVTLAAHVSPLAAQAFEGVITVRVNNGTGDKAMPLDLEYMTRAGKLRLNAKSPLGNMALIVVPAEKKLYTLMDAQAMYMEQPFSIGTVQAEISSDAKVAATKIVRTGRKETVAGCECEHVLISSGQGSTDVCLARGLGPFVPASAALGTNALPAWQRALADDGGFPLKVSREDGSTQLEVTKIEKRSLPASLFTVPDSYTKMDMPMRRGR